MKNGKTITVRRATRDDLPALAGLNREVQEIHAALFPDIFRSPDTWVSEKWFREQLGDNRATVLVATDSETILGYIVLRVLDRPAGTFGHARQSLYVDHICVTRSARQRGVGRALIAGAKARARDLHLPRLELDVWTRNRTAREAFEALGFQTQMERMTLPLD